MPDASADVFGAARPLVLVTRPEPGAAATAAQLAVRGFEPVVAPMLRLCWRAARLPEAGAVQAVVVTSGNALPGLAASLRQVPLYAVGDATASRARALGFASVASAGGDAGALAALVGRACRPGGGALLLASGARQGGALAAALRGEGFAVLRRVLYEARPVGRLPEVARAALGEGRVAAALFFSAETAEAFVRLVGAAGLGGVLANVTALAIAEPAASVLRRLPFRAVRVALRPNEGALLAMLHDRT